MNHDLPGLCLYLGVGLAGGILGHKLRIPSGALIGSMVAVIAFKLWSDRGWSIPGEYNLLVQVLLGVMIGASFDRQMLAGLARLILPVAVSTLVLVGTGILLCLVFARLGLVDLPTAYLGTNPGAMSILVILAFEHKADPAVVLVFHFVRVVFVMLTAPWIVKLLSEWR